VKARATTAFRKSKIATDAADIAFRRIKLTSRDFLLSPPLKKRSREYASIASLLRSETVEGDTRVLHNASVMSSTRRAYTPARYISISASSTESLAPADSAR
jgi:hypothetical protein